MKIYTVSVKQETIMEIEAASEEEALEEAYSAYLDYAADTVDARIVSER